MHNHFPANKGLIVANILCTNGNLYTDLNDEGTVFNSAKNKKSNVSALNGYFFKVPG